MKCDSLVAQYVFNGSVSQLFNEATIAQLFTPTAINFEDEHERPVTTGRRVLIFLLYLTNSREEEKRLPCTQRNHSRLVFLYYNSG